ncbi:ATP-binding cassette subfamily F protein 3 [Paenibacillus sp. DS2015]|uniref:ribosomal protection-like ABC-F family protein n=1 Tax=Paenibacillus sp. DS2015 TaxID=3373917 RepID=UPI003D234E74
MMSILKGRGLGKEWNGKLCFEHVDIEIYEGERIALCGSNGVGKSTLFQILTGEVEPNKGTVERHLPVEHWGVMQQHGDHLLNLTTLQAAQYDSQELCEIKQQLLGCENELQHISSDQSHSLLEAYGHWMAQYEQLDGFRWEIELEKILTMLQISSELWGVPFAQLSGGQKTRVRLASLLVRRPQFLMLDEPTNHLDESSMLWLEQWLLHYEGTVLFVSHDRTFLDRVATGIGELTEAGLKKYKGNYSDYRREKDRELREQEALHKKQQQAREALEESIRRYQDWFNKADRAATKQEMPSTVSYYKAKAKKNISRYHAKQKEMERLDAESVQKPRSGPKLNMQMGTGSFAARNLVRLEQVDFEFKGHRMLFNKLDYIVARGDRIAIRGANGTGKSTLLKLIMGHTIPNTGEVRHHPALTIGYFSQELDGLDDEQTLLETLLGLPDMTESYARTILGCFLFSREDVFKKVGVLSMGERCRIAFVQLYFSGANLLVLDEPTNYLDIVTREVIEDVLQKYPGALVVVSHDRMLVRKLANRLLTLSNEHEPQMFEGTIEEEEERISMKGQSGVWNSSNDNARIELAWELSRLLNEDEGTEQENTSRIEKIRMLRKDLERL